MGKRIFSKEERQELLTAYRAAEQTMDVFCKLNNLNPSTLYSWLKQARDDVGDKPSTLRKSNLTTVRMLPVVESAEPIIDSAELILPRGLSLRFSAGAKAAYIASVVKALA